MKLDNVSTLALLGIGGFLIYKSDILKGVGQVSEGVGAAAQGLGGGIADIGQAAGDIGTGFAAGVNSVLSLVNPLGSLGTEVAQNITARGDISESNLRREASQSEQVDISAFSQSSEELSKIQSQSDIYTANQSSLRKQDWESTKTNVQDSATNVIESWASAGSKLVTYNPASLLSSFVQSVKSLRTPKVEEAATTQSVSSGGSSSTSTSSVRSSKSSGGSSSLNIGLTQSQQDALTKLNIPLVTTKLGVVPESSIRTPVSSTPTKKWYDPRTWF